MPNGNDIVRATEDLRKTQEGVTGALANGSHELATGTKAIIDFFQDINNLVALAIVFISIAGMYRLLRAEHIIPSYPESRLRDWFAGMMTPRLAMKIILFVMLAALGLALSVARMSDWLEKLRSFF